MRERWLGVVMVVLVACGTSDTDGDTDDTDAATDTADTEEERDVDGIRACLVESWIGETCTGCHFGNNHLVLTSDPLEVLRTTNRELFPSEPIMTAGEADSIAVRKILAKVDLVTLDSDEGDPMPPDQPITEDEAKRFEAWVVSGAPDCPQ